MAKRIGVFVDVSNLYYCIGKKYQGRKLDYKKYLDFIKDYGKPVIINAYGAQLHREASKFIRRLKEMGYETFWKRPKTFRNQKLTLTEIRRKADWDVGIAVDMIRNMEICDRIILGSADSDLVPVIQYLQEHGKQIIIVACGIAKDLKDIVRENDFYEIPESLLESNNETINNEKK